jgi:hypothetical protein
MRSPHYLFAKLSFYLLFLSGLSALLVPFGAAAQNSYPASGDALIHGLTIGTGAGSGTTYNTALGVSALTYNTNGFSNVAVGNGAMFANSNGYWNTATGTTCLYRNTTGISNTATGFASLSSNTTGSQNTVLGTETMQFNVSGSGNTATGLQAMYRNSTGNTNTAMGISAMFTNTSGYSNVAIGAYALEGNSTGSNLVAVGDSALYWNTGGWNTAIGSKTLYSNTSGSSNTALGYQSLYANTGGSSNTAAGYQALYDNQGGPGNTAFGVQALFKNTGGEFNVAVGNFALWTNTTGAYNVTSGPWAMYYNTTGSFNCASGMNTLQNNTTGYYNSALGYNAGVSTGGLNNTTELGYNAIATASNSVVIGNNSVTSIGGYANWTNFSDGRYKKNINENVPGLVFINKLKPVTYTLDVEGIEAKLHAGQKAANGTDGKPLPDTRQDPVVRQAIREKSQVVYTGFVAQDVYKTAQSIGYNFSGVDKPGDDQKSFYGLRYSDFVVPLVKAVQELSAANDSLAAANAQLNARLTAIEQKLGITNENTPNKTVLSLSSARLDQNTPNPFNQTTLISYYLPQASGSAIIQITDIFGQPVKSVPLSVNGYGQLTLQTGQLAAGTYTYSLIVGGQLIDTKKMLLVK